MNWLVTGASSGVGRVMAVALAAAGHRVLLTGRNEAALSNTASWCPGALVLPADLADPSAVEALARRVEAALDPAGLAGLVHAAGLMLWDSPATPSGWSLVPAVNAVAPWKLTLALEPALLASASPRVLFVAGAAFTLGGVTPHLDAWRGEQKGKGVGLALEAAAAKVFMARELHRRWQGRGSAFAFHPGYLKSHLADGLPFPLNVLGCLAQGLLSTRCDNGEFLALDAQAPSVSGHLVDHRRARPGCPRPEDPAAERAFLDSLGQTYQSG